IARSAGLSGGRKTYSFLAKRVGRSNLRVAGEGKPRIEITRLLLEGRKQKIPRELTLPDVQQFQDPLDAFRSQVGGSFLSHVSALLAMLPTSLIGCTLLAVISGALVASRRIRAPSATAASSNTARNALI